MRLKKFLFVLLMFATSVSAQEIEDVTVMYKCRFQTYSLVQEAQVFEGQLELTKKDMATSPWDDRGILPTHVDNIFVYLVRNPHDLSEVYLTIQDTKNFVDALTYTPGVLVSYNPVIYESNFLEIKNGAVEMKSEIKGKLKKKKYSGELSCQFSTQ